MHVNIIAKTVRLQWSYTFDLGENVAQNVASGLVKAIRSLPAHSLVEAFGAYPGSAWIQVHLRECDDAKDIASGVATALSLSDVDVLEPLPYQKMAEKQGPG